MARANQQLKSSALVVNQLVGSGSVPTAAAGTGAGTGPTITVAGNSISGTITVLTGSAPAASNATIATISFPAAFDAAPYASISPANAAAAALSGATACFVDSASAAVGSFVMKAGSSALAATTSYIFSYRVIG